MLLNVVGYLNNLSITLNGLLCAATSLRIYSLTAFITHGHTILKYMAQLLKTCRYPWTGTKLFIQECLTEQLTRSK